MTREIKFRGIDYYKKEYKNKTEFVYGSLLLGNNNNYILTDEDKESMVISIGNHAGLSVHRITKDSEEQYTGLKDKNGKEIYEGDILNIGEKGYATPNAVIFQDGCYGMIPSWEKTAFVPLKEYCNKIFINCVENIGNVHENPELLESNK